MRNIIRYIRTGFRVGEHPGTPILIFLVVLGFIAGVDGGTENGLLGALIMLLMFGPVYLFGAYEHGRDIERERRNENLS